MGIFNLFNKNKPDAVGLIAYNTAYIYYYLESNYKDDNRIPEDYWGKILMAGTLDAFKYLNNQEIISDDLILCQKYSKLNQVMGEPYSVNELIGNQHKCLILFIINLQCLLLRVDLKMNIVKLALALTSKRKARKTTYAKQRKP